MFIFMIGLATVIGLLGARLLLAGARYRFRNRTMNLVEGAGLWAAGVAGLLTWSWPVLLLTALVGMGISLAPNSQKRLE